MATTTSTTTSNQKTQSQQSQQSTQKQNQQSTQKTQQSQQSVSTTQAMLNEALRDTILSGLKGYMTDDEIQAFAENLLKPQLNAGKEAAQQTYEASKLGYEQQIENLAVQLAEAINKQNANYTQNVAQLENAALARGMGRSSYLLDTEAQLGQALSETIKSLTDENARQTAQIGQQMTLAAQQNAQTQGRLDTDYASQLAAKVQELKETQRQQYNQNYMSAISAALGQQTMGSGTSTGLTDTTGTSLTEGTTNMTGTDTTDATSTTITSVDSGGGSGGGGGSAKKEEKYDTYISGARRPDENKGTATNPNYTGGNVSNVYLN